MDEAWERAVEAALEGQGDSTAAPRTLTLDGAVKCVQGRLPPPTILERFQSLEHLSIANVGVSSLEKFPKLPNLQRLILSDNRIASGLEFLVEAGLESLRDLDLSNNRIQYIEDLAPLAQLRLVSLDLYECPVTRVKDYRSRVFGMIRSLKYLDKMDSDENERPESDEEEEDEEDEEEDEDPVSGEIDGDERTGKAVNGVRDSGRDEVIEAGEDEESDADEEEMEDGVRPVANGSGRGAIHHKSNGFRVAPAGEVEEDVDEEDDVEEENDEEDLGEEVDEEDADDDDVVEVHEIEDSDEEEDVVEEEEEEEEDVDDEDGEEEEDVEDEEDGEPGTTGRLASTEGEIDGHDHGEDGDEDENGEIGEEDEQGIGEERDYEEVDGDGEDEEEDLGTEYLVQPVAQVEDETSGSDFDACNEDDESDEEVDDDEHHRVNGVLPDPSSSSQPSKRKRDGKDDLNGDSVDDLRSSKHR